MEHILRGKEVAAAIMERNRPIIADLKEKGITPTLAIFRVGEKEADLSYERGAIKRFEQCGIQTVRYTFDENVSVEDFYQKLDEANKDLTGKRCGWLQRLVFSRHLYRSGPGLSALHCPGGLGDPGSLPDRCGR